MAFVGIGLQSLSCAAATTFQLAAEWSDLPQVVLVRLT